MIAGLEYLLRILNTAPGHLGNMKQAVSAAQVYECTEVGNVLNSTLYGVTCMDALEELFLKLSLLSNHKLLSVADDSSSLRVELSDNEIDILTCVFG